MYTKPKPSQESIRQGMQLAYQRDAMKVSKPWLLWEIKPYKAPDYRVCVESDFPFNFVHYYRRRKV
jgi:hypothetical protein